jgi:predicted  nucleic acid-binding Zn-ribbon protein
VQGEEAVQHATIVLEDMPFTRDAVAAVGYHYQAAGSVVQSLEDQLKSATERLTQAEEQSAKVGSRAELLEARAGSLRFAEKRITQFEEKLAQLDKVEEELGRSIETLIAR